MVKYIDYFEINRMVNKNDKLEIIRESIEWSRI